MRQLEVYICYERAASGRPSNKYSGTGYPSVWSAVNKPSSARCHKVIAKATQPTCCNSPQEYVDPVDEHKPEARSVRVRSPKDPKYPTVKPCRTATCRVDADSIAALCRAMMSTYSGFRPSNNHLTCALCDSTPALFRSKSFLWVAMRPR